MPDTADHAVLCTHPVAAWAETTLGLQRQDDSPDGKWVRTSRPKTLAEAADLLARASGRPATECLDYLRRFLLLATTLDRLMLGLRPFWGDGRGAVRWLDVQAPPRRLAAALWAGGRGRPEPWMAAAGYNSGRAERLRVAMDEPFVLDGEVFEPGPGGVLLSAPDRVAFVSP